MCSNACRRLVFRIGSRAEDTYLLHHAAPVHLGRQGQDVSLHLVCQNLLLGLVSVFKELLNNVVAEHIRHQLQAVGLDLAEHLFLLIAVGRL